MSHEQTVAEWMNERGIDLAKLVELTGLDLKVAVAIVAHRYTTSPDQRSRIARALGLSVESVQWGKAIEVDHMYGHGPQFGRSP